MPAFIYWIVIIAVLAFTAVLLKAGYSFIDAQRARQLERDRERSTRKEAKRLERVQRELQLPPFVLEELRKKQASRAKTRKMFGELASVAAVAIVVGCFAPHIGFGIALVGSMLIICGPPCWCCCCDKCK
jgi:Flp pilus assembly protein TadB